MRGQGRVYRPRVRGRAVATWWLDYSLDGTRHREPAHTRRKSEALEVLRQRIGDRKSGKVVGRPDRLTLADLRGGLERHFGLKLAFQNCHRVAAFRPAAVEGDTYRDFISPAGQLRNQSPELRDC